ncbi:iron dicitrate transporter FecR [Bacteroidia bacterium]|nr:iron dicitrate transporter FecR [Bacteroidia bacterium]
MVYDKYNIENIKMDKEQYLGLFEKYMAKQASEKEINELINFIRNNPQLNCWFENQIQNSPAAIDQDLKQRMLSNIQKEIGKSAIHTIPVKTITYKWLRAAAIILLPLVVGYGIYAGINKIGKTENTLLVSVEAGEKANITLPDGSRVWLNSSSKLTYTNAYNNKKRLLKLDGEAYFEVAHDAQKPFIVQCIDMETKVLGTTFGIKAYDEDNIISVVLAAGKVQVTLPDETRIMQPDERVVYNKSTHKLFSTMVKPSDFTDWRKNRLRFENETLLDIATTISRIHNIDYVFEDETLKSLCFTGSVDNTNVESVLNAITLTAPITYTVKDNLILFQKDNRKKNYFN